MWTPFRHSDAGSLRVRTQRVPGDDGDIPSVHTHEILGELREQLTRSRRDRASRSD